MNRMPSYRVLVVDDNHEIRRMVTASIKTLSQDIDVLDVPSAEEALLISSTLALDLVVLDFRLPGMNGVELVARLRKRKPELKIILVTGVEDTYTRQQVAEAGVAAYFYKPLDIGAFLEAVRKCLWVDQVAPSPPEGIPTIVSTPPESPPPVKKATLPANPRGFHPTLKERLAALKQQVRAASILLIDTSGQILDEAGNPDEIITNPALLPALTQMHYFSQKACYAMPGSFADSLTYFASSRQRLYLASVGASHAMLLLTQVHVEPEKLGLLDRAIHLAVEDLKIILEQLTSETAGGAEAGETTAKELPDQVNVDQETQAQVAQIFSRVAKKGSLEQANDFWEGLNKDDSLTNPGGKDILSYDQARKLGLAPDDDLHS